MEFKKINCNTILVIIKLIPSNCQNNKIQKNDFIII